MPLKWRKPRLQTLIPAVAACLLLVRLGTTDLWTPDEPRYGQIAEELRSRQHGAAGLVLLHLNGEPYADKPPFYYWLAALAGAPHERVTEGAARLPSALAGIALVALVLRFGSHLLGGPAGALGAALLLTTFEFARLARRVQLDVVLALFETVALLAFWRLDRGIGGRRANLAWLHGAAGLAVLTKGPVGLLIPALVMAAYLFSEGRWRQWPRAFPVWGLALSVGPGLIWLAAALAVSPAGFLGEALGENVLGRFFAGTSHVRPVYYYLYQFPVDFLPWSLLIPLVVWAGRRRVFATGSSPETARAWRFLLAWIGASLIFFSLSTGKRGLYLLPAFPAAALLCADSVVRAVAARDSLPRPLAVGLLAVALALGAGAVGLAILDPLANPQASLIIGSVLIAVAVGAVGAWVLLARLGWPLRARLAVPVAAVLGVELVTFGVAFPALDPEKSPRPIAEAAAALTAPDRPVGLLGQRSLVGGLVYYGGRKVVELNDPESALRFVRNGGRTVILRERDLGRLVEVVSVEERFRARSGRRTVLVATARPNGGGSPRRRDLSEPEAVR